MLQISQENTCVEFSLLKRNSNLDVFLSSLRRQPYQFPLTLEFLLQVLGIIDTLNILAHFGKFYRETPVPEISMEKYGPTANWYATLLKSRLRHMCILATFARVFKIVFAEYHRAAASASSYALTNPVIFTKTNKNWASFG